ncbi:hypothetical protein KC711_05655 [Candidatus Peregrinibacteria bacterium]|nr:hypothetical protein [Candidatus Peregrinibacteria bacterium]MCB9804630.1 hypothetical protein [Candidatus Peribacteria bacterium]
MKMKEQKKPDPLKNHKFYENPDDSNGMEIMLGIIAFGMIIVGFYILLHNHFPLPREVELKSESYSIQTLKSE